MGLIRQLLVGRPPREMQGDVQLVRLHPSRPRDVRAQRGYRQLLGGGQIHGDEEAKHGSVMAQSIGDGSQRIDAGDIVGKERHQGDVDTGRLARESFELLPLRPGDLAKVSGEVAQA